MAAAEWAALDLRHVSFVGAPDPVRIRPLRRALRAASPIQAPQKTFIAHREQTEVDPLIVWLLEQAELDPSAYRGRPLQRRLPACLRALRVSSPAAARRMLELQPRLIPDILSIVLLGVSEFFRDREVFAGLKNQVLPELARGSRDVRIWSAGCSDGQELYSVAVLLDELDLLDESMLLGTDCRADAIRRAREGIYGPDALSGLATVLRRRCFELSGTGVQVAQRIRGRIRWFRSDLLRDHNPGLWDMILWRNGAIYLTSDWAAKIWRKLAGALRPGGFLITGRAERPANIEQFCRLQPCVYRRMGD